MRGTNYDINTLNNIVSKNEASLTDEQLLVYKEVLDSIRESNLRKIIFLDASRGAGKIHLINLLLAKVRSSNSIALAAALSDIVATLLDGGKTSHSLFKLPLNLNATETPTCNLINNQI